MGRASDNLPYVSLYQMKGRWFCTLAKVGGRRITQRLGVNAAYARTRAGQFSDWMQRWKSGLLEEAELLRMLGESRPIDPFVREYEQSLVAAKCAPQYVRDRVAQLRRLFLLGDIQLLKHFTSPAVAEAIEKLKDESAESRKRMSDRTVAHYFGAAKQFGEWLVGDGRNYLPRNPLEHAEAPKVVETVRDRRAPTRLELELMLAYIWDRKRRGNDSMNGRDRAVLYLVAACTGLRANEIRQLLREWFGADGILHAPASITKNSKKAGQPMPAWLIELIDAWHPRNRPKLFARVPKDTAQMVKRDLEGARKAWVDEAPDADERARRERSDTLRYKTADGHFDFHALRHAYVTALGDSGASVKDMQTLARHSTSQLTLDVYSHSDRARLRAVVNAAFVDPTPRSKAIPAAETPKNEKGGDGEAHAHRAAQSGNF